MNWSRAKNILIVLFVAIDVFLLALIAYNEHQINSRREDTLAQTVSILAAGGITVDKQAIPDVRGGGERLYLANLTAYPHAVARALLGETYEKRAGAEGEFVYANDTGTLTTWEDRFCFEGGGTGGKAVTPRRAQYLAGKVMESLGVEKKYVTLAVQGQEGNSTTLLVTPRYEGVPVEGTQLILRFEGDILKYMQGNFFVPEKTAPVDPEDEVRRPEAVLPELLTNPDIQGGCEIVHMEQCYYVPSEGLAHSRVEAQTAYLLTDRAGSVYIYDAGTGVYLGRLQEDGQA